MVLTSRIVLALLLGLLGYQAAQTDQFNEVAGDYLDKTLRTGALILIGVITGAVSGGLVGKLVQRANGEVREQLAQRSGAELVVAAVGLLVGLGVAILFSFALRPLEVVGTYLLLPITLIVAYVFAEVAAVKHEEILRLVGVRVEASTSARGKLLDSSALIDGRIRDVLEAGFVEGQLVVPLFVLEELQLVADSDNDLRRRRGRRGLDMVAALGKLTDVASPDIDVVGADGVDGKLVRLARDRDMGIITTDVGLAKVARSHGVSVLNINELANAIKPAFIAGEQITVRIVRDGKEPGQGVGYLDDGTMVVVAGAEGGTGRSVRAEVTQVLQTSSGKMVFAETLDEQRPGEPGD